MRRTGLVNEPAFDSLHFLIEGIPPQKNQTILGLYFPEGEIAGLPFGYLPPSTIILPVDATEDTLLHELGHRYGDFYYNDLSEQFAENWHKSHQKGVVSMFRLEENKLGLWERVAVANMGRTRASIIPLVVGDFEITNLVVFAEYKGKRVTQVPLGANFEIHAEYNIVNYMAGFTWWTTCMTVFNVTDKLPVDADTYGIRLGAKASGKDAINLVMPARTTMFRVIIWANQEAFAGAPPESQW